MYILSSTVAALSASIAFRILSMTRHAKYVFLVPISIVGNGVGGKETKSEGGNGGLEEGGIGLSVKVAI